MLTPLLRAGAFVLHAVLASAFHRLATLLLAVLRPRHPFLAALLAD
jgi:hypothetical protein